MQRRMYVLLAMAAGLLWLNWRGPDMAEVVSPVMRNKAPVQAPEQTGREAVQAILPAHLERPPLELAERDPFASQLPKPAPAVRQPQPLPQVQTAAATVPSAPIRAVSPPLNLRFTGRMTTPDGRELIYLALGMV